MPFDADKFGTWLREHALGGFGAGLCATHVREALAAGGLVTAGHPRDVRNYGPFLERLGFHAVSATGYLPQAGDVAVFPANKDSSAGHVEGYDGKDWISDFIQPRGLFPGPAYRRSGQYVIYRQ